MSVKEKTLDRAKSAKEDEFYTQLPDIENELKNYRKHFKDKVVFCNCDDPFESNFFKYFVLNFNRLGLKKLIATCYSGSSIAGGQLSLFDISGKEEDAGKPYKAIVNKVYDANGDGGITMLDVAELFKSGENELTELQGNGDFRSAECIELLDECDIVVTNPPFSLFREYMATLIEHEKKFLIIGNLNAISYKEIFPLMKENKVWLGYGFKNGNAYFSVSNGEGYAKGVYDHETGLVKFRNCGWFTNLDIKKRHEELILVKRYSPDEYPNYDNYDAIEVSATANIPCDYDGVMGVPITFLDKHSPEQFEIIGIAKRGAGDPALKTKEYPRQTQINKNGEESLVTKLNDGPAIKVEEKPSKGTYYIVEGEYYIQTYARILIKNKHPEPRG